MPKNKRPAPRKANVTPEDKDEASSKLLADLALELAEREDGDLPGVVLTEQLRLKEIDFQRLIRKALNQKKDDVLYEAIERAAYEDVGAYQFLRGQIEEAASTIVLRREGAPAMEINAFVIPLFVHSTGGLKMAEEFQDQDAFEALLASIQQAGLESPKAKVVLMQHAYDLDEIDRITYSHLNEMVRESHASMTDKKMPPTPALERSLAGWAPSHFAADDAAIELRFLLGFALKRADDAFYQAPKDEAGADAYFEARMQRYEQWAGQAGALMQRCLAPAGAALEINFLYQDLFHGGKEQGMAEYFMLQMMSEINQALEQHQLPASQAQAIAGPVDVDGQMRLRLTLLGADGGVLASSEKPLDLGADLAVEIDDIADALGTLGIVALSVAQQFDAKGNAIDPQPYQAD